MQSKLDKSGPPKAEEVVRAFDNVINHVKELSETAARLGGSAGETLLEESTAQACFLFFCRATVHQARANVSQVVCCVRNGVRF